MKNDYIRNLQANHYQAEDYCNNAQRVFSLQKKHTKEEAEWYLKACECYLENVKLSAGEERKHYQHMAEECKRKIFIIDAALKAEKTNPTNPSPAGNKSTVKKENMSSARQGNKGNNEIDTEQWFRQTPRHSFEDVAGMEAVKKKLMSCAVDAKYIGLKRFLKMKNMNALFFYGPPGTGKTYIVEAFAHEMVNQGYKYICLEAKDILSRYVGEAEKIIGRMFEIAEENAPCVVFIDEIDGVCKSRSLPKIAEYEASITTAFLTGYNRINSSDKDIVFIGATNFPERVDSAMHSRVELIRIPLPDCEARSGFFKHCLETNNFRYTISPAYMAEKTMDYDCRDMGALVESVKQKLFERAKEQYLSVDAAIHAIENGEFTLDEKLFAEVYNEYIPIPKKADKERLDKWESARGVTPGEASDKPKAKAFKPSGCNADLGKDEIPKKKIIKETVGDIVVGGLFDARKAGKEEDGREKVHNPIPERDIERAFYHAKRCYPHESVQWQEGAQRYREILSAELTRIEEVEKTETTERRKQEIARILGSLNNEQRMDMLNVYKGMEGSDFLESYDGFSTVWQGRAVRGFGGTCGIVASCNVINQQTGSRLREEEGVNEFVSMGLCYVDPDFEANEFDFPEEVTEEEFWNIYGSNGGTTSPNREIFVGLHGLDLDLVMDDSYKRRKNLTLKMATPPELTLELMEERMCDGDSIILVLKLQDLQQAGLSDRTVSWENPSPYAVNHATTVAGFTYSMTGRITGVWINETGGATESTRVYISAEKFALMRENTRGFSAEFTRKRG